MDRRTQVYLSPKYERLFKAFVTVSGGKRSRNAGQIIKEYFDRMTEPQRQQLLFNAEKLEGEMCVTSDTPDSH